MPGFMLAKKVYEIYKKNPKINCLILMNHGIFTFANDAKEAYEFNDKICISSRKSNKKTKS